ncbi:hypothetical protein M0R45_035469 [Rubus argutus]|uniref:Uncharacterized protein n=1 Tax=Rubus argutus TaxID=59490 RepID=A0AAW1VXQ6_RUBAR
MDTRASDSSEYSNKIFVHHCCQHDTFAKISIGVAFVSLSFRRHLLLRLFSLSTNASFVTAALNHAARAQSTARTHPSIHPKSLSGRRCNFRVPKPWELKPPPCKAQLTSSIHCAADHLTPLQLSISAIMKQFWTVSSGGRRPLLSAATE